MSARSTPWSYWRPLARRESLVEWSSVRGTTVGLPPHFHDEDQITFVIAGRRRFRLGDGLLELGPGELLVIPAGMPHTSLHEPAGAHCLNAYLAPGAPPPGELLDELERLGSSVCEPALVGLAGTHRPAWPPSPPVPAVAQTTVAAAAARAGMSREGFTRAFRRAAGMPPHAFRLTERLNRARGLLRTGAPIAEAAAETGFADQSHLGRCFRRAFGVTPGAYRAGL